MQARGVPLCPVKRESRWGRCRLLEKEIPRLRRYAIALTHERTRADDLVQDTLIRAIEKQRYWKWGTNLRVWRFTIMHNQNVNAVRRGVREGNVVAIEDAWPTLSAVTDPTAPLSLQELERALARIPGPQRQVVLLVGLDGTSYEEAAAILNLPIGTVRSRLSRGREALRSLMDRQNAMETPNSPTIMSAMLKRRHFGAESVAIGL